jgi:hypothetical protein
MIEYWDRTTLSLRRPPTPSEKSEEDQQHQCCSVPVFNHFIDILLGMLKCTESKFVKQNVKLFYDANKK